MYLHLNLCIYVFYVPIILRLQKLKIFEKFNKQNNKNIGNFMTRSLKQ